MKPKWTPKKERVYRAAMARWQEYLASHKGDEAKAIAASYSGKGAALSRACAAAKRRKGGKR